LEKN
jgi:HD superfamily phosphodiesterase